MTKRGRTKSSWCNMERNEQTGKREEKAEEKEEGAGVNYQGSCLALASDLAKQTFLRKAQ